MNSEFKQKKKKQNNKAIFCTKENKLRNFIESSTLPMIKLYSYIQNKNHIH